MMPIITKYEDEELLKEAEELRKRFVDMLAAMGQSEAGNKESKQRLFCNTKKRLKVKHSDTQGLTGSACQADN